jgi:hypothetical protein
MAGKLYNKDIKFPPPSSGTPPVVGRSLSSPLLPTSFLNKSTIF